MHVFFLWDCSDLIIKKEKSHVTLLIRMGIELARTAGGYQLVNILYMTERMFVKSNHAFFANLI